MPRKLRLNNKKNYERNRQDQCRHESRLTVSIPLIIFIDTPINTLSQLYPRLDAATLPSGWLEHRNARRNSSLFLSCYRSDLGGAANCNAIFTMTVNMSLKWSITCNGRGISTSSVFGTTNGHIRCIQQLMEILELIKKCKLCCGNSLTDFQQVLHEEEKFTTNIMGMRF